MVKTSFWYPSFPFSKTHNSDRSGAKMFPCLVPKHAELCPISPLKHMFCLENELFTSPFLYFFVFHLSSANEQQCCTSHLLFPLSPSVCLPFSPSQFSNYFSSLCPVLSFIIISSPPAQLQTLWSEICIPRMGRVWGRREEKERERGRADGWKEPLFLHKNR